MDARPFLHPHRVTYAECTLGDHVYYARYLDQFEEARGALFASVGQTFRRWQEAGVLFPVIEATVRYRAPARYDDRVTVAVTVTEARRFRLSFHYRVTGPDGRLLVEGETRHVCTDTGEKPCRIPGELATALGPHTTGLPVAAAPEQPAK